MKPVHSILPLALLLAAAPAAAASPLKCDETLPGVRTVKLARLQALKRDKAWTEGPVKTAALTACDARGLKTAEAEYDAKVLRTRLNYEHREPAEARELCKRLKSDEKLTTTFSGEAQSALDEFCRRNKKKDIGVTFVYDQSPSRTEGLGVNTSGPVRQVFTVYNDKGFPAEEFSFDPQMNLEARAVYTYDKGNNLTEQAEFDLEDRQLRREAVQRDAKARTRTHLVYGETNELKKKTVFEYREDGTLLRESRADYDAGGQLLSRSEFRCGPRGAYEKEFYFDGDSAEPAREYSYDYAFDKKGNWVRETRTRVIIYNGNRMNDTKFPPEISRRELQYY